MSVANESGVAFSSLDDNPIGASRDELNRVLSPFVLKEVVGEDREWTAVCRRRYRKINAMYMRQRFFGWLPDARRVEKTIKEEYGDNWASIDFSSYDASLSDPPINYCVWGDRRIVTRVRGIARMRLYLLARVIDTLRPRRVLEVGSGNGINLLVLAGLFPETEFVGLELTDEGIRAGTGVQAREALPDNLLSFAPAPIQDPTGFKRIRFEQGSAADLPFEDAEFDLVFTSVAVEQMESIRHRALGEIARTARDHVFLCEPFYDVNKSGIARRYVVARDYFQGPIGDLPRYGLEPYWATNDLPHKINNCVCAVLCRKSGKPEAALR